MLSGKITSSCQWYEKPGKRTHEESSAHIPWLNNSPEQTAWASVAIWYILFTKWKEDTRENIASSSLFPGCFSCQNTVQYLCHVRKELESSDPRSKFPKPRKARGQDIRSIPSPRRDVLTCTHWSTRPVQWDSSFPVPEGHCYNISLRVSTETILSKEKKRGKNPQKDIKDA